MTNARLNKVVRAVALFLVAVISTAAWAGATSRDGGTEAGTLISNRAEATYADANGIEYATVSPTVTVTVRTVAALAVTPDETEPSASTGPNERVERLFRICNTGNASDLYTITAAEIDQPAAIVSLHFDSDSSGTLTDADREITLNQTMSPRVARGACTGVVAVIATNAVVQGQQLAIRLTARSNVMDALQAGASDVGTIINVVGRGAFISSPADPQLPPVKLVSGRERVTAATGQPLDYEISFRNSGDVIARRVVLRDDLPEGLTYVAGTLRLNDRALTDAEDTDEGHVNQRRIEIKLAQLNPGETVRVAFQARIGGSIPAGRGVVNTASVSAENASSTSSTSATAVTSPFGLVYQGRTAGTPIAGARVSLLVDSTTGTPLQLAQGAGAEPNADNANPFTTDGQGRWNFTPAPTQLGTPQAPVRYFLNVTANGYRARLIELALAPKGVADLFTLTVRALDGQPVAEGGGFQLIESNVLIEDLAALAINVPLFEVTALGITKSADRPSVEIGDTLSYRIEIHNETPVAAEDVRVRDLLPHSFHYAAGTARIEAQPAAPRAIEPEIESNGALIFNVGRLAAGARASIIYRVRVGANAREGEQFNAAQGSALLMNGERVTTTTARAAVRVRRGLFSSQQVIVGRVFEDANGNGLFDDGERGLAGVRLYLNNGESVITDSAGLYNFPVVNEGSQVISLDPVTLPQGHALADSGRREEKSWTRLLRTPLGGGGLLRQNFALRSIDDGATAQPSVNSAARNRYAAEAQDTLTQQHATGGAAKDVVAKNDTAKSDAAKNNAAKNDATKNNSAQPERSKGEAGRNVADSSGPSIPSAMRAERPASGTYEIAASETVEPVAAGEVRVLSPRPDDVVAGAALEVTAQVNAAYTVAVEVAGHRVPDSKIGERRIDNRNRIATFTFVGINVAPGPNRVRVTSIGPNGEAGRAVEFTAYGRGPARRVEIVADKHEVAAGGRDSTILRVRAFDQWGRPAADGSVAIQTSTGRLLRLDEKQSEDEAGAEGSGAKPSVSRSAGNQNAAIFNPDSTLAGESQTAGSEQQIVQLVGGEGRVLLVAGSAPGAAVIRATTGAVEAQREVRITPEVRPAILIGLAEVTVGAEQPELSDQDNRLARRRLAFFYRGQLLGSNLLTLAYDSNRALNRLGRRDRLFQYDPLERAYPIFGDSSTRFDDAQSNSKLYVRVDRGRSYFLFGDFETENREAGLASYTRRLTGVKLHLENSRGDYVSVTGARPDTSFARDVFPGGTFTFARLSRGDVLPGSEVVAIEVRDRRNPEVIISRELLIRSVDYNLDAASGEIFFLRPVTAFDFAFNLVQVVVTYEHGASGASSDVYTARAFKTFEGLGLKVGLSFINQRQGEMGSFVVGGVDAEKSLPRGGHVRAEWATSQGRVAFGGNLFGTDADARHDGQAFRAEMEQPLKFRETTLRAGFSRAAEGFLNPFGQTVTPGSQRFDASIETRLRPTSRVRFGFTDERNRTVNVNNSRRTLSALWSESFTERVRATFGYDFRRFRDDLSERDTDSHLVTAGLEWQATDKLQLSVKREQNLTEADPTYPDQTTLAANYRWNQYTRLFFTQRLANAPIVPISDAAATGFVSTGARRETAIGVETKLGRIGNLNSRYQLENGINGSDSFAVIGLSNRLAVNRQLSLDLGYERGFHLAGEGESFNSGHVGFSWTPVEDFRASGRYELRDRNGLGTILTLGAAGRLLDNLTSLARFQFARSSFNGRDASSLNLNAAVAWRPLESDRAGLLFSYNRRDLRHEGGATSASAAAFGELRDRSDTLSSDWYYQASRELELYGRFGLRLGDNTSAGLERVTTLTYLMQTRAAYRFARSFDLAGEGRWLAQPASATRRASFGAELGYWMLADLRVGGGYNWTGAFEPNGINLHAGRRGFYFTISSKLSNLFDLFGTRQESAGQTGNPGGETQSETKKKEEEE